MTQDSFSQALLPGLPIELIRQRYAAAPGNEIDSGKFANPESSAALAANTFGYFLERPAAFPPLIGGEALGWPAQSVDLECTVRFPWSGGHHPCLDAVVETTTALIGIESKRYEPFRSHPAKAELSEAYWRPVWGDAMRGYESIRDTLRDRKSAFHQLDAAQLFKHAFALRTAAQHASLPTPKKPVLVYIYAEPTLWSDGSPVSREHIGRHREEIRHFSNRVAGDEVAFLALPYCQMLWGWIMRGSAPVQDHAIAVMGRFGI